MTITPNKWELDVQGYLNTCNITSATPRKQIRDFSAGVNDLGLWNSMVCWPLRSSQNAATGDTMFSLGGLGTFNGTLVNNPTRGADGLDHAAASSQTTTTPIDLLAYGAAGFSLFTVAKLNVNNTENMLFGQEGGGASNSNGMIRRVTTIQVNVNYSVGNRQASLTSPSTGTFATYAASVSNAQLRLMANASHATATPSGTYNSIKENVNDSVRFASRSSSGGSQVFTNLTSCMGGFFNLSLSESQLNSLRDLYKDTLGQGLGLP